MNDFSRTKYSSDSSVSHYGVYLKLMISFRTLDMMMKMLLCCHSAFGAAKITSILLTTVASSLERILVEPEISLSASQINTGQLKSDNS